MKQSRMQLVLPLRGLDDGNPHVLHFSAASKQSGNIIACRINTVRESVNILLNLTESVLLEGSPKRRVGNHIGDTLVDIDLL